MSSFSIAVRQLYRKHCNCCCSSGACTLTPFCDSDDDDAMANSNARSHLRKGRAAVLMPVFHARRTEVRQHREQAFPRREVSPAEQCRVQDRSSAFCLAWLILSGSKGTRMRRFSGSLSLASSTTAKSGLRFAAEGFSGRLEAYLHASRPRAQAAVEPGSSGAWTGQMQALLCTNAGNSCWLSDGGTPRNRNTVVEASDAGPASSSRCSADL